MRRPAEGNVVQAQAHRWRTTVITRGIETLSDHVLFETLGNRDQMACPPQTEPLRKIVDAIQPRPARIAQMLGCARDRPWAHPAIPPPPGCPPCRRRHRMGVNQGVLFPAHYFAYLAGHAQIQTVSHGQIIDWGVLRLQQFGEVFGFYTCESDLETRIAADIGPKDLAPVRPRHNVRR